MNTPNINIYLLSSIFFLMLILLFLFFSISFFLNIKSYSPSILPLIHDNFRDTNGCAHRDLVQIDISTLPIHNIFNSVKPIQLVYNHIQNRHKSTTWYLFSHVPTLIYASFLFTCCFFYLTMTGNNISVMALSVGGNGPPIHHHLTIILYIFM